MSDKNKRKLRVATSAYWLLLFYIVAALVWWFISLEKQNNQMTRLRTTQLELNDKLSKNSTQYLTEVAGIEEEHNRNLIKYVSEGSTFLLLTLVGAAFVYRSVRRQFMFQQQQQNFMMAVTHELKTPVSIARLNLETLQKHQLDADKQKKLIRLTLEETERLNTLTNNILISSQLEGDRQSIAREELDLSTLFKDCVHSSSQRFSERLFIDQIAPDLDIKGDPFLLQLMISNLLENAVKYSPREKPITCSLKKVEQNVQLQITDEGTGISDSERKNIFKKFYRIGDESTRQTQGTGLGLYLCKKIAEDHAANIKVVDNLPSGSSFIVTFGALQ